MEKRETSFVSLRLDADLVRRLDELAELEGLTRTDVIERLAAREFKAARLVGPVSLLKQMVTGIQPLEGDPIVEWLLSGPPTFRKTVKIREGKRP